MKKSGWSMSVGDHFGWNQRFVRGVLGGEIREAETGVRLQRILKSGDFEQQGMVVSLYFFRPYLLKMASQF